MAVLLSLDKSAAHFLAHVLLNEAVELAQDPDLARLHRRVLLLMCAVMDGKPVVLTEAGRTFLMYALKRAEKEGQSEEARTIMAQLVPCASEVGA